MNKIEVFESISSFQQKRAQFKTASVGFVPTMGALHPGHASLIEKSARENDITVLSIYVNPTQFNSPEDLKKYPRTLEADIALAEKAGAQILIYPQYAEIYADEYRYQITEKVFSKLLCGAHRPGHFDGVLTIVMKLIQIVQPKKAYFGEKDYQQFLLINDMAKNFFLPTEIIPCPTLREPDGLAMSSRNLRLNQESRQKASLIYQTLKAGTSFAQAQKQLAEKHIQLEYLEEHFNRRFIAAHIDGVRLIDNVSI